MDRVEEIRKRIAALPDGFVLGVEGSYYDTRHFVMGAGGEPDVAGDGGLLDPNEPELLAFRDHAVGDLVYLLSEVDRLRAFERAAIAMDTDDMSRAEVEP